MEEFNYEDIWDKEEEKKTKKKIDELPKGLPRKGIKGKYIKKKNHITRNMIRGSYGSFIKEAKKEFNNI